MGARTYDTVSGFFVQDDLSARGIPAIPPRFGLVDATSDRWLRFFAHISGLNQGIGRGNTSYKVFFLGRHGEGYHNVAEAKYGTMAWDDHWSKLNGDGGIVWGPDPELTPLGKGQAEAARDAWIKELASGIPLPDKLYTSPLSRAMDTCKITFGGLLPVGDRRTIVVENLREENGIHTCDKRRTKTYIQETFPEFDLEPDQSEHDLLWEMEQRETKSHVAERARGVLDGIFENDKATFISITAHGGIINGLLQSLGRPIYALPTGGILPVVVKSTYSP